MLCVVTEDTERVIGVRRLRTLRDLGAQATLARTTEDACRIVVATLAENTADVPFALLYLKGADGTAAELAACSGLKGQPPGSPGLIDLNDEDAAGWLLAGAARSRRPVLVTDVRERFGDLCCGRGEIRPKEALVLPIHEGEGRVTGFLVAGISPARAYDDAYRGFLDLAAIQIATTIGNSKAYEEERRRAEALAELDQRQDRLFLQRQSRIPHAAHADARPGRGLLAEPDSHSRRTANCWLVHRNALAAPEACQYAAGFLPHRGGPRARIL